ncbi:MAG: sulfatase [Xanthomonadales bacterium]|nr:sulfatase [Xanthomonadales bacterium]
MNSTVVKSEHGFRLNGCLKPVLLIVVLLALAACGDTSDQDESAPPSGQPVENLIIVAIDTVRWDTWWVPERTGKTDSFSPWVDSSQVMSKAVSPAPWTVPAVSSVLTGLYPSQHGGGLFDQPVANLDRQVPSAISGAVPTLAEILASVGVNTAAVSAHPWFDADYGLERGFGRMELRSGAEQITRRGLAWLEQEAPRDEPFFLYLHYMDAHDPHLDLPASRAAVEGLDPAERQRLIGTAPSAACDDPEDDICVRYLRYALATLALRESMAQLLGELEARGTLDDTLVVLYSDHGEEFHDHLEMDREWGQDPRGIYGFGHGNSLYQEQLHVPLMLWHPELDPKDVDTPVSLVDIVPSVLGWMGVSLPEQIDYPGRSFARDVEDRDAGAFAWREDSRRFPAESDRRLFASGIAYGPEQMAVISEGFKLIWHETENAREFFNLAEDPLEQDQLAGDDVPVADELDAELGEYFQWFSSQDYLPPALSDDVVERLKGVGYLQGVESRSDGDESGSEEQGKPEDRTP